MFWLPAKTPAEALLQRIYHELAPASSKPQLVPGDITQAQVTAARDHYMAQLAAAGVSPQEIAAQVGLSLRRTQEIVSAYATHRARRHPTPSEVATWASWRAQGMVLRDIADHTRTGAAARR